MTCKCLLYIDKSIQDYSIFIDGIDTTNVDIINDIPVSISTYKRIGLVYPNNVPYIPILFNSSNQDANWFSKSLCTLLKEFHAKGIMTVDIITCNLNTHDFVKEVNKVSQLTGLTINYSTNQTGNGGSADWILESNNENLIGIYFTDAITNWHHKLDNIYVLDTVDATLAYFNSSNVYPSGQLTYNTSTLTYTLLYDVTLNLPLNYTELYIKLLNYQIFDGNNHFITLTWNTYGLFALNNNSNTIKNLKLASSGTVSNNGGGSFARTSSINFTIYKCTNYIKLTQFLCGGICGKYCSNFVISHCANRANVYLDKTANVSYIGGIVSPYCNGGIVKKCYNYCNYPVNYCGGIVGANSYGFIVTDCINKGNLGDFGGGIMCTHEESNNGYIGTSQIINCVNYGNIGNYGGGIIGINALSVVGNRCAIISIKNCINYGNAGSCGIIGYNSCYISYSNNIPSYISLITIPINIRIEIYNCQTKYGSIVGDNACGINVISFSKINKIELYIENSTTQEDVPIISSLLNTCASIIYNKNGTQIDLTIDPYYKNVKII